MRGIEFYTMKREGLCRECSSTIPVNKKIGVAWRAHE